MEAIYYAVPMVGMPIFIDQGDVLIKMKDKGIAVGFDKENTTWQEIHSSLKEVLYNPKYQENIQKLSVLMRDVKETPLDRATEFLEYVMRHRGADHLKLSSRHLNFFQYFCLDTILFLLILALLNLYLFYKALSFSVKYVFWNSQKRIKSGSRIFLPDSNNSKLDHRLTQEFSRHFSEFEYKSIERKRQ